MKKAVIVCAMFALAACSREHVQNPDPNHTHADFAIWVDGAQVDFSESKYMSGLSTDEHTHDEEGEYLHKFLHLHDGNGNVLHSHKSDQTLREFFDSLGYSFSNEYAWRMFINGEEHEFDLSYAFQDMDQILLTTSSNETDVLNQIAHITDEACLYSKTCPWRGDPPTENCVADPEVPCVETE